MLVKKIVYFLLTIVAFILPIAVFLWACNRWGPENVFMFIMAAIAIGFTVFVGIYLLYQIWQHVSYYVDDSEKKKHVKRS